MASWLWIVIIVVLVAIVVAAVMAARRRRTMALRQRFGTEYDRTLDARDGQRAAEADLRDRERERGRLDIKPLSEASRARYAGEWRAAQQSFVDQPEEATAAAYDLVNRVMAERGYPMRDFDARADLVSVDHPDVVENYRVAHGIHERAQHQQASTEDLREAMIRYRSLFEELLGADGDAAVPAGTGPAGARHADEKPASPAPARPASDEPARSRTARDGEVSDDAR
jgi:FtsZ-interacting cell division protein ZipA